MLKKRNRVCFKYINNGTPKKDKPKTKFIATGGALSYG
ncbi:hypothetical protein J2Z81_001322 [Virgibacillus campisalis]|uniref:Uncharacterized protein n=1 Tax=Virgibacillus alimentarius TaxID=698769 RepID=A0ABS4S937_9BACI|nr:hypothetical protein [Virgibacillus alimentarius]